MSPADVDALTSAGTTLGGAGGAVLVVRWLLGRAVKAVDDALLRMEGKLTRLEASHHRHAELLAIISHELGIRNRTSPGKD